MALSLVLYASCSISWGGRTSYLFVLSRGAAISATAYIGTFVVTFGGGVCVGGCYLQVDSTGPFGVVPGTSQVTSLGKCTQECGSKRGSTYLGLSVAHLRLNVLVQRSDYCSPSYIMSVTSHQ